MGRAVSRVLGHLSVHKKSGLRWTEHTHIYIHIGGDQWPGHLVRGPEGKDWKTGGQEVWGRGMQMDVWEKA